MTHGGQAGGYFKEQIILDDTGDLVHFLLRYFLLGHYFRIVSMTGVVAFHMFGHRIGTPDDRFPIVAVTKILLQGVAEGDKLLSDHAKSLEKGDQLLFEGDHGSFYRRSVRLTTDILGDLYQYAKNSFRLLFAFFGNGVDVCLI